MGENGFGLTAGRHRAAGIALRGRRGLETGTSLRAGPRYDGAGGADRNPSVGAHRGNAIPCFLNTSACEAIRSALPPTPVSCISAPSTARLSRRCT
ncbi:MAG: hypothetical protein GC160_26835 [Acidobacteria bacterium]|nr:hypothetical protein [Acidobacteriota bacterium]